MIVNANTDLDFDYQVPNFEGYDMEVCVAAISARPGVTQVDKAGTKVSKDFPIAIWWNAKDNETLIQIASFEKGKEKFVTLRRIGECTHFIMRHLVGAGCP